ncbi:MAG: prolyl oligopeptidase family serine peptidase [Candidatus Aminicenantaceae bacterium]
MSRIFKKAYRFPYGALIILVCLAASLVFSQEKRPFTPEDLLNLKRLSDPQISPTGDWVSFVVTKFEENQKTNSEIWIVSRDGRTLKQITVNPGPDQAPRWSSDGKTVAFLSRRDKDENSQIYFYSLKDGEVEKVTDEKSSISDLKWSPDSKMIAFLMRDPRSKEEIERRKRGNDAFIVDQDYKHTRLWILDIDRKKTGLLTNQDMTIWNFNWSPDSKKIIVLASPIPTAEGNEYQSHLGLIHVQSGEEIILCRKTNAQASPSFSFDGKWIAYMGPVGTFKERGIVRVIPSDGGEPVELLKNYDGNVWDVTWHPRNNTLLAAVARGTRCALLAVNLKEEIRTLFDMDHSIIPYWGNYLSVSSDGNYVAYLNEKTDSPGETWISNLDGTFTKKLTSINSYLKEVKLGKIEAVRWQNPKDSSDVEGVVVKPVNFDLDKRFPLIVWLHGGPAYNWGLGIQVSNWAQLFASQGYMVFLPNFRGSSGYGMAWMMANVQNWGEGPMSDVMSGVDHLIEKGWVDKDRLFVGGGSYGGYLTSWIITHTDRFKAAFVRAGVSDIITEYALTDEPSFLIGYFKSSPYENPEIYRKNSPLTYASQVKTPVLIVHGEKDLRVPVSQAYQFYSALKHFGAKATLVIYPREYHGTREYVHQIDLMNRVLNWFK